MCHTQPPALSVLKPQTTRKWNSKYHSLKYQSLFIKYIWKSINIHQILKNKCSEKCLCTKYCIYKATKHLSHVELLLDIEWKSPLGGGAVLPRGNYGFDTISVKISKIFLKLTSWSWTLHENSKLTEERRNKGRKLVWLHFKICF